MLIRLIQRAAVVAVALTCLAQAPALAGGGPPGSAGFGFAQCGQSGSPSCTVTAGTPPGGGTHSPAGNRGSVPGHGGGGTAPAGPGAGGPPLVANRIVPVLPPPVVLAQQAVRFLLLPGPVIESSPSPAALQLTRLPVWLWIVPGAWRPVSKTAQVPGESVTATATPVSAAWSMGDGITVTCHGPGTPYSGQDPAAASPTCGHTYERSSAGEPGGAFRVMVTVTWEITWTATGGAGGALAPLRTAGAARFRVAESQALNTSGG